MWFMSVLVAHGDDGEANWMDDEIHHRFMFPMWGMKLLDKGEIGYIGRPDAVVFGIKQWIIIRHNFNRVELQVFFFCCCCCVVSFFFFHLWHFNAFALFGGFIYFSRRGFEATSSGATSWFFFFFFLPRQISRSLIKTLTLDQISRENNNAEYVNDPLFTLNAWEIPSCESVTGSEYKSQFPGAVGSG